MNPRERHLNLEQSPLRRRFNHCLPTRFAAGQLVPLASTEYRATGPETEPQSRVGWAASADDEKPSTRAQDAASTGRKLSLSFSPPSLIRTTHRSQGWQSLYYIRIAMFLGWGQRRHRISIHTDPALPEKPPCQNSDTPSPEVRSSLRRTIGPHSRLFRSLLDNQDVA